MAYAGYLMKIGTGNGAYTITGSKYIQFSTYEVVRKVQDLDPYRDANGVLHRNALPNIPLTVKFSLMPSLSNIRLNEFLSGIQSNYINALERKVSATVYVPETDTYITQDMYLVEPTLKIQRIDNKTNTLYYEACEIKFVGY
jgi:hypothetical protein